MMTILATSGMQALVTHGAGTTGRVIIVMETLATMDMRFRGRHIIGMGIPMKTPMAGSETSSATQKMELQT